MTQTLIENITALCKEKGISINQMVSEAGVNKSFVDNLKKGSSPSVDKLLLIAQYFCVSIDYLVGLTPNTPSITILPSLDEQQLLEAYRAHPELQPAIRKLLDMPEHKTQEGSAVS